MEKQHYYDLDESWLGLSNFLRAPTATHVRGTAFQIARVQRASLVHYAPRASTSALRYLEVTARWYGTFVEKHNHPLQTYALPCAIECTGPFWDKSFEVVPRRNLTESGPRTEKHEFAMRSASWIEMGHGVSVM